MRFKERNEGRRWYAYLAVKEFFHLRKKMVTRRIRVRSFKGLQKSPSSARIDTHPVSSVHRTPQFTLSLSFCFHHPFLSFFFPDFQKCSLPPISIPPSTHPWFIPFPSSIGFWRPFKWSTFTHIGNIYLFRLQGMNRCEGKEEESLSKSCLPWSPSGPFMDVRIDLL